MAERDEDTLDTIRHLKRQEPFATFRIMMSSGDRYSIENPDALAIATSQVHYYPRSGMGIHMRLNQVAAVEVLEEKAGRSD
jgi:pyridoxine/pyridoxamine 5'-phosphate oxidase